MTDYPEVSTDQDMYITEEMTHWIIRVLSSPLTYSLESVAEANRQADLFEAQCEREIAEIPKPVRPFLIHGGMHV